MESRRTPRNKIVILGAGTAGTSVALRVKKTSMSDVDITLVDRNTYHTVMPLIYQVVTGSVAPNHISFSIRKLLKKRWYRYS